MRIDLPIFECLRCGHVWLPRKLKYGHGSKYPISCPQCRSVYWDTPFAVKTPKGTKQLIDKAHGSNDS